MYNNTFRFKFVFRIAKRSIWLFKLSVFKFTLSLPRFLMFDELLTLFLAPQRIMQIQVCLFHFTFVLKQLLFKINHLLKISTETRKIPHQFNQLLMPKGPEHVNWYVNVWTMIFVRTFKGILSYSSTRHKLETANV